MDYLPQPYPLWCASVAPDDPAIDVGRVVGWGVTSSESSEFELVPVVAREDDEHVTSVGRTPSDETVFFAETRQAALDAARWAVGPACPDHGRTMATADPFDAAMRQWVCAVDGCLQGRQTGRY